MGEGFMVGDGTGQGSEWLFLGRCSIDRLTVSRRRLGVVGSRGARRRVPRRLRSW